jgi:hypothetical protein
MSNLFAFSNRHDIRIDLAIALRRSVLMVSTLANFSNGMGRCDLVGFRLRMVISESVE